jgi:hypothetical protein
VLHAVLIEIFTDEGVGTMVTPADADALAGSEAAS